MLAALITNLPVTEAPIDKPSGEGGGKRNRALEERLAWMAKLRADDEEILIIIASLE